MKKLRTITLAVLLSTASLFATGTASASGGDGMIPPHHGIAGNGDGFGPPLYETNGENDGMIPPHH